MMKFKVSIIILLLFVIVSAGCASLSESTHDSADKIYVDYVSAGYYYFEDDNNRGYNWTIYQDDTTWYVSGKTPTQFITDVRNLEYSSDKSAYGKVEVFTTFNETLNRGFGDCEDLSLLLARGLHDMGFDTCVFVTYDHVFVGINKAQVESGYLGINRMIVQNMIYPVADKNCVFYGYYALESTSNWAIGYFDEYDIEIEKIYYL